MKYVVLNLTTFEKAPKTCYAKQLSLKPELRLNEPHLKTRPVYTQQYLIDKVEMWKEKHETESNKNIKSRKKMQNGDKI